MTDVVQMLVESLRGDGLALDALCDRLKENGFEAEARWLACMMTAEEKIQERRDEVNAELMDYQRSKLNMQEMDDEELGAITQALTYDEVLAIMRGGE
jgi:hypothetical protein